MSPKVSIIIPVFNAQNYLAQCLDSLIGQTLREIEIICVNDGSIDQSLSSLQKYASIDNRIIIIDQQNSGVSIARNNALKHVRGEYYMFVDSDDWLDVETCEVAYEYAKKHSADCLMFSYVKEFSDHNIVNHIFSEEVIVWDDNDVKSNFHRRLFGPLDRELSRPQDMDIMVTPCMQMFKTSKFSHIEFVDIKEVGTFEDGLYQMILYNGCESFVYIDQPFYHYRKTNETSITSCYNADLPYKFDCLWNHIESYINNYNLDASYSKAFKNRVALSLIGLGLNQVKSQKGLMFNSKAMRRLLNNIRVKKSLEDLQLSFMPISWKVFFYLCKCHHTVSLVLMLYLIEYLRTHKK